MASSSIPVLALPVRAGVIPKLTTRYGVGSSTPRTRGGHPRPVRMVEDDDAHSPYARGSSRLVQSRTIIGRALPVRAGVIPTFTRRPGRRCRTPRTRGGHPWMHWAIRPGVKHSPYARGSSLLQQAPHLRARALPVRAGVILSAWRCTAAARRTPRTRGGHPLALTHDTLMDRHSPYARGSSHPMRRIRPSCGALPVRAGVIPVDRVPSGTRFGTPRTRGGHPFSLKSVTFVTTHSPYARGSSLPALARQAKERALPVRAGVIPTTRSSSRRCGGTPRTRGGHPLLGPERGKCGAHSPYARGSSPGVPRSPRSPRALPVRAGVIPTYWLRLPVSVSTPRTRGGHPVLIVSTLGDALHSPYARGSSRSRDLDHCQRLALPVRAGVIPFTLPVSRDSTSSTSTKTRVAMTVTQRRESSSRRSDAQQVTAPSPHLGGWGVLVACPRNIRH